MDQQSNDRPPLKEVDGLYKESPATSVNDTSLIEPTHHKHAKIVMVGLFAFLLITIGALSYFLTQESSKQDNSQNTETKQEVTENEQNETVASPKLIAPTGYVFYEGDGFGFFYPESWGEVSNVSTLNDPIFVAEFTVKTNARLFLNSGNQDFSSGGRGGAYWDCVGYTDVGSKDIACKAVHIEDNIKVMSGSALKEFEYIQHQNSVESVVLNSYESFEESIVEILFNPSSSTYYGGTLLLINPDDEDIETMRIIGSLFSLELSEGL
jgi:hypothetical protein